MEWLLSRALGRRNESSGGVPSHWVIWLRLLAVTSVAASVLLLPSVSEARQCTSDSECPKGFTCEEMGLAVCPEIACAEGADCEPIECEADSYKECVSIECDSDDDCAEGMVCHTETWRRCDASCPEGASDEECAQIEDSCAEESTSSCVPRYALSCEADGDCGAGFSCVELESCGCAGSAGSAEPAQADAAPPPDEPSDSEGASDADPQAEPQPEPGDSGSPDNTMPQDLGDCFCEPSGEYQCELNIQACESSDDCPQGFECGPNPEGGACWMSSDGDSGCSEPDPAQVCLPPYYDLAGGRGFSESAAASGVADGLGSGDATGVGADPSEVPTAAVDTNGSPGTGEAESIDSTASSSSDSGGCQLSSTSSPSGVASALGLLMLGAFVSRRRRSSRERSDS